MLKTGFMQKKKGHDWGGGGYSDVSVNYRTNHVDSIIVPFALPPVPIQKLFFSTVHYRQNGLHYSL